jgi:NAD(P)-dependent dehydrogenase (short-subunit alcohol dehydrogenase family)
LLHQVGYDYYKKVIDVDLNGTFLFNKAIIAYWHTIEPRLIREDEPPLEPVRQRGALVNIASVNAHVASPYMGDYTGAKHGGTLGFAVSLRAY